MRKLRKIHSRYENSVEAYVCDCSCACVSPNPAQFQINLVSTHNNRAQGLAGNQPWIPWE